MTTGMIIGGFIIVFIIWLVIPDKKGEIFEEICVSIYEVLIEKNPEITLEDAKVIIYEVIVMKELKKFPLKTLEFLRDDISKHMKSHGTSFDIEDIKRIVNNSL